MNFNFDDKTKQELLDRVTLATGKKLAKRPKAPIDAALAKAFKKEKDPLSLMALALMHAAWLQKRIYCVITRDASVALAMNCLNAKFSLNKNDGSYKTLLYRITSRDDLFRLVEAGAGRKPAIYELTEPELRKGLIDLGVDPVAQLEECKAFVGKTNTPKDNKHEKTLPTKNGEIKFVETYYNYKSYEDLFQHLKSKVNGKYWVTLPKDLFDAIKCGPTSEYLLEKGPVKSYLAFELAKDHFLNGIFSKNTEKQAFKRNGPIHKKLKESLRDSYNSYMKQLVLVYGNELIDPYELSKFCGMVASLGMQEEALRTFDILKSELTLHECVIKFFAELKKTEKYQVYRDYYEFRAKIKNAFIEKIHQENQNLLKKIPKRPFKTEEEYWQYEVDLAEIECLEKGAMTIEAQLYFEYPEDPKYPGMNFCNVSEFYEFMKSRKEV